MNESLMKQNVRWIKAIARKQQNDTIFGKLKNTLLFKEAYILDRSILKKLDGVTFEETAKR